MKTKEITNKIRLIVSEEDYPKVRLKPGLNLKVEKIEILDEDFQEIQKKIGSRLCGGSGTCLALIDIDTKSNPVP